MKLLKMQEVAVILGISLDRAYSIARDGILPVVYMGRQVRVDREKLSTWIEACGKRILTKSEKQEPKRKALPK
ncbi:helix-turn-helix domain-containing protein [Bacillus sp. JJ1122]|uniref:helix-turn-helix domain-containing protein n=1 Tax=Bacillus sp. JJ1122 TaxID=3122951 RepID=UPI0030003D45